MKNDSQNCDVMENKEMEALKKITNTWEFDNMSILTDTGFEKITSLHETIPYEIYQLILEDGKTLKCADNHIVFYIDMKEVFVKDLQIGDEICVIEGGILSKSKVTENVNLNYEEIMYDFELPNNTNHRYYTNGILSHNTAIVNGLAMRILEKKVSRILHGKRIVELDLSLIVSGTKYRGQFEERMKAIVEEIEQNSDVIVFIDELHTIVGAGNASNGLDASNMIKPALARGEMQIIGATTFDEYKKSIEKDAAMERRFQKIIVEEPSIEETKEILHQSKGIYEEHHGVKFDNEAIDAAVEYAGRYI